MANEKLDTWSSLGASLEDWKKLLDLAPTDTLIMNSAKSAQKRLPPRMEERKTQETAEMMGKLKDLGNTVLGKFGLSTDNFKFVPNGAGGYSMNFSRD